MIIAMKVVLKYNNNKKNKNNTFIYITLHYYYYYYYFCLKSILISQGFPCNNTKKNIKERMF